MEAINLVTQVFTYVLNLLNSLVTFFFGNWVTSVFFAGCLILFVVNLVILSSSDDSNK